MRALRAGSPRPSTSRDVVVVAACAAFSAAGIALAVSHRSPDGANAGIAAVAFFGCGGVAYAASRILTRLATRPSPAVVRCGDAPERGRGVTFGFSGRIAAALAALLGAALGTCALAGGTGGAAAAALLGAFAVAFALVARFAGPEVRFDADGLRYRWPLHAWRTVPYARVAAGSLYSIGQVDFATLDVDDLEGYLASQTPAAAREMRRCVDRCGVPVILPRYVSAQPRELLELVERYRRRSAISR